MAGTMRALLVAVLIAAGLSGCSRGPSCADLEQKLKIAEIHVTGGQLHQSISGSDAELRLALTEQQALMDDYVAKGCS